VEKEIAEALQFAAESEKDEVVPSFYPEDDKVTTPPDAVPSRSCKMSDETKRGGGPLAIHQKSRHSFCGRLRMQKVRRRCSISSRSDCA